MLRREQVKYVDCAECGAKIGEYCVNKKGMLILSTHKDRKDKYRAFQFPRLKLRIG